MANLYFRAIADTKQLTSLISSIRQVGVASQQVQAQINSIGGTGALKKLEAEYRKVGATAQLSITRAIAANEGLIVSAKTAAVQAREEARAFQMLQKAVGTAAFGTGGNVTLRGLIQQTRYLRGLTASYQAQLQGLQSQQAYMARAGAGPVTAPIGKVGTAQLAQLNAGQAMTFNTAATSAELARVRLLALKQPLMGLSTNMINLGKNAQFLGRNLTTTLTLPLILGIRKATSMFLSLNKEITRIQKVAGAADFARFGDSLQTGISDLVKTFGISQQSVAKLTGDVVSMGYAIRGASSEAYKMTEAIAFTSTLGDIGLSTSRDFFRTMLKVFTQGEEGVKTFNDQLLATNFIVDQLNQIENKTVINLNQLAEALPKASGAAKLFGLNAAQLASVLTGVYDKGIQLDTAATGVNFILTRILNPTKQAAERFDEAFGAGTLSSVQQLGGGMEKLIRIAELYQQMSAKGAKEGKNNFTEIGQVFGELVQRRQVKVFIPMVQSVITGTQQIKDAIRDIPGLEETLKADGVDLATAKLDDLKGVMGEYRKELLNSQYLTEGFARSLVASSAYTELSTEKLKELAAQYRDLSQKEIEIRLKSPETQFAILQQTFRMVGVEIGKAIIPPLLKVMHALADFFEGISKMSSGAKAAFAVIALGLAGIGPAIYLVSSLATVFGVLTRGVFALLPGLKFLTVEELNLLAANNALDDRVLALGNRYIWLGSKADYYNSVQVRTLGTTAQVQASMANQTAQTAAAADATAALAESEALAALAAEKRAEVIAAARELETLANRAATKETLRDNKLIQISEAETAAASEKRAASNAIVAKLQENLAAAQSRVNAITAKGTQLAQLENNTKQIAIGIQNSLNESIQIEQNLKAQLAGINQKVATQRMKLAEAEKNFVVQRQNLQTNSELTNIAKRSQANLIHHKAKLKQLKEEEIAEANALAARQRAAVPLTKKGLPNQRRLNIIENARQREIAAIQADPMFDKTQTNNELRRVRRRIRALDDEKQAIINQQRILTYEMEGRNAKIAALEAEAAETKRIATNQEKVLAGERRALQRQLTASESKETKLREAIAREEAAHKKAMAAENAAVDGMRAKGTDAQVASARRLTKLNGELIVIESELAATRAAHAALQVTSSELAEAAADAETKSLVLQLAAINGVTEAEATQIAVQAGLIKDTEKLIAAELLDAEAKEEQTKKIIALIAATNSLTEAEAARRLGILTTPQPPPITPVPSPVAPLSAKGMKAGFARLGKGALTGVKRVGAMIIPGVGMGGGAAAGGAGAAAGGAGAAGGLAGFATMIGPMLILAAAVAAIVAAVLLLRKHWDDVSEGMKNGLKSMSGAWNELKKAFAMVADIFSKSMTAVGGAAEEGAKTGNVWNSIGKIIGGVITIFAKLVLVVAYVIKALKPLFEALSDIFGSTIGFIVSTIQFLGAILSGDWDRAWKYAAKAALYALKAMVTAVDWAVLGMVKALGGFLSRFGIKFGKTLAEGLAGPINRSIDGLIKKLSGKKKVTYTLGVEPSIDRDSVANITDPADNLASDLLDKTSGGGNSGAAANAFNDFLQKLKQKLDEFINKLKDQVSKEFDNVWSQRLKIYDDQIAAIDLLEKKEEELLATQQYIESRREAMQKRSLDRENYRRNRALAIYEGRIDDARMMDLEFSQTDKANTKSITDLEEGRARDLLKKARDRQRERINIEKKAAEDRKAIEEKALKDQIDLITKYTPKTDTEWRLMMDQINSTLATYGIPAILGTWQNGLAIFQQSIAEIATDVKNDNFWSGSWIDESMRGWLELIGGQNYRDAIYEIGRAQGESMGSGFADGSGGAGGGGADGEEGAATAQEVADAAAQAQTSKGAARPRKTPWGKMPKTTKQFEQYYQSQLTMLANSGYKKEIWDQLIKDKSFKDYLDNQGLLPFYKDQVAAANTPFSAAGVSGELGIDPNTDFAKVQAENEANQARRSQQDIKNERDRKKFFKAAHRNEINEKVKRLLSPTGAVLNQEEMLLRQKLGNLTKGMRRRDGESEADFEARRQQAGVNMILRGEERARRTQVGVKSQFLKTGLLIEPYPNAKPGDDIPDGFDGQNEWYILKNGKWSKKAPSLIAQGRGGKRGKGAAGDKPLGDTKTQEDRSKGQGKKIGKAGADGTAEGYLKNHPSIASALKKGSDLAEQALLRHLQIKSPSQRFANKIGKPMAQGIAKGVQAPSSFEALTNAFNVLLRPFLIQKRDATLRLNWTIESGGLASGIKKLLDDVFAADFNVRNPFKVLYEPLVALWENLKRIARALDGIYENLGPGDRTVMGRIETRVDNNRPFAMAAGGIVKRRPGGILANIGEGRYDEAVIPLTAGLKNFANSFQPAKTSMRTYEANMSRSIAAALKDAGVVGSNAESGNVNIYVDNFIGQPQWFESMMTEYGVKVAPNKQRSYGTMNRRVTSYQDNAFRTGKI